MTAPPRALVAGASRMLGAALARALRAKGWDVRATARAAREGVEALDVTDADAVRRAVDGCDAVFHLAAHRGKSLDDLADATRVNVGGAANVLAAAVARGGATAVVLVGSAEEYGRAEVPWREDAAARPASAYGATKLAATVLARAASERVPAVVLRPGVIYGPGQPDAQLVANAVRAGLTGGVCALRGGTQTRDMVYVDDVAAALVVAAERARGAARGRVINLGSGVEVTVREVAERVIALARGGSVEVGPASTVPGDTPRHLLDVALARELLGWSATTPLDDGLARTLDAARAGQNR